MQLPLSQEPKDEAITYFTDILLPVPIPKLFTYRVPQNLNDHIEKGKRVIVQFGKKRVLTGIIGNIHQQPPEKYEARYLLEVLDEFPTMTIIQLQLFNWIADYYLSTAGEVLNIGLPSGLKLSSESQVQLHPDFDPNNTSEAFSEKEWSLIESLRAKEIMGYQEIGQLLGVKHFYHLLKSLLDKEAILIFEEVKEKYKPKTIKKVKLQDQYARDYPALQELMQNLEKAPKQLDILLKYLQELPVYKNPDLNAQGLEKSAFTQENFSANALQSLIKKGIFTEMEKRVSRFDLGSTETSPHPELTDFQKEAKANILQQFEEKDIVLLHGVTGSGKTEIYIELIREALDAGHQVLYLLPEIALTTQIVSRLKKVFGNEMGVYHSKFSDNERVEVWHGVLNGTFPLVVGVRSSVLLPFDNLGLVIIDEEHETSYKQFDPAPRYNARDTALMLGKMHHAKMLLGSATPAVESYYNSQSGKYGLVKMEKRFGEAQLPEIHLVDIREEIKRKTIREDFTSVLIQALTTTLENKKQAIIFQNRRGYAPFIICEECATIPKCEHCDVSLTYHQYKQELRCHYCGHKEPLPASCPACGSTRIKTSGYGTEKLEEELRLMLPEARIQRMDLDTTRSKNSYQQIIENFAAGHVDILVGTQMVSKGLDFDRVNLVGILDADRLIHFPDFRSFERAFQLITQVSGRAGRRIDKGQVYIQTYNTGQSIFNKIIQNDYESLYQNEIAERRYFKYPPFLRMVKITLKNADKKICWQAAQYLRNILADDLGPKKVLGPEEPLVGKIRNQYLVQLMIKLEKSTQTMPAQKQTILEQSNLLKQNKKFKNTSVVVDVDPY